MHKSRIENKKEFRAQNRFLDALFIIHVCGSEDFYGYFSAFPIQYNNIFVFPRIIFLILKTKVFRFK